MLPSGKQGKVSGLPLLKNHMKRYILTFYCPKFNTRLKACSLSCNHCPASAYADEKTTVVNVKDDEYDVYIGRGTPWGNRFKIGVHGTREEVIEMYKQWFLENYPLQNRAIKELSGRVLGCHCKPLACHGDVIVEFLENNKK